MLKFFWFSILLSLVFASVPLDTASAQQDQSDQDAFAIRSLYDQILASGDAYGMLYRLAIEAGPRISGSEGYRKGSDFMYRELETIGFDTVWMQGCEVTKWVRGHPEEVWITGKSGQKKQRLRALALGNSPGTGDDGMHAGVVEVKTLAQLDSMDRSAVEGKIVFFNRPFDPTLINCFSAYGRAVDQRVYGPARAAKKGALAAIVRSMTGRLDTIPHTGVTLFGEGEPEVPAIAISTVDADILSAALQEDNGTLLYIRNNSRKEGKVTDHSVIAEIRGSEFPDEIILAGGHLDSWDVGHGAHDDGAGCVHSVVAMKALLESGYQPRRTWRIVLFANEENGLSGGTTYAEWSGQRGEFHLLALESDAGGHSPRGFTVQADEEVFPVYFRAMNDLWSLLEPYDLYIKKGGGGADISRLIGQKGLLMGLRPDTQRYFDFHHAPSDRVENVHPRELALGAAAMAGVIYLVDKYGLNEKETN